MSTPRLYPTLTGSLDFPSPVVLNAYSTSNGSASARANAQAVKRMSRTQRMLGGRLTVADIDADWAAQRERVRARWLA